MQNYGQRYVAWQGYAYTLLARDFTRNGLDALGPIIIGLDLGQERTTLLCTQMPERAIYRIRLERIGPGGSLVPVCNGAVDLPIRP